MQYINLDTLNNYLSAREDGKKFFTTSLDLGISKTLTSVSRMENIFSQIKKIRPYEFYIYDGKEVYKPNIVSDHVYSLHLNSKGIPILLIDGVRMNVSEDVFSYNMDVVSNLKIDEKDVILECCTGLGYQTKALASVAQRVHTIEKSDSVVQLSQLNPYSKAVYKRSNIVFHRGDAFYKVKEFEAETFDRIVLDPPSFGLCPELYTEEFYLELYRVAKDNCRIFHYTGSPGSKFRNKSLINSVSNRMQSSGFKLIFKKNLGGYFVKD